MIKSHLVAASTSQPKFICVLVCGVCGVGHPLDVHDHAFTYRENDKHYQAIDCLDPFSQQVIFGPCILPCGHTFSENCGIIQHLGAKGNCPICRAKFTVANISPAPIMMKNMMNSFQVVVVFVVSKYCAFLIFECC